MCPLDEKNNLKVGHMPPYLTLNHTEARFCSKRYIFCKISNLPPGGQFSVQGKCTNMYTLTHLKFVCRCPANLTNLVSYLITCSFEAKK